MKAGFASKNITAPARRRVELAIAVAQERLIHTHVEHALDLIERVGGQIPFESALGIYTRLLRLSEDEARVITTRALALLGERAAEAAQWPELVEQGGKNGKKPGYRALLGQVRQRLRGRVNDELRRWIELSAARTEVALIETHLHNALNLVELLEQELPFTAVVELYLDALDVRDSVAEVVYYMTLARLSEQHLPPVRAREPAVAGAAEERRLRVLENGD